MNTKKVLMLGAMYENGGNTTHRFLDGHPQLAVYPFESQLGTKFVNDMLSSTFPLKYRWPVFPLESSPFEDYKLIIDEEGKVRSRTPFVSKFRDWPFEMNDDERCNLYQEIIKSLGRSRPNNVYAFFRSTFESWKNFKGSGNEEYFVGYSPILAVDAEKILSETPTTHFLHIVRNPWSAYADTKKRPVPLGLENYMLGWTLNQYYALLARKKFPERMHIVRAEDVMNNSRDALTPVCQKLRIDVTESLNHFTWNSHKLNEVYPWGTIRIPTPEQNIKTAEELSNEERQKIKNMTWQYLEEFNYIEISRRLI